jgi:ATP-dependent helicase HrpB
MSLPPLPIDGVLAEITSQLRAQANLVLRAPPGAGKSTRVPPAILDAGLAGDGQVVLLEPRRLAARAIAARISHERGSSMGREIGYQVRFDSRSGPETRILAVTEGIFLRKLQSDPFLDGISVVVFDEFHERNLSSDLALGMVRRIQQTVRGDLRIVVMSATLEPGPLSAFLGNCPVVESPGRSYPVDIRYLPQRDRRSPAELAAWGIEHLFPRTAGDVLVFLPGVGEIHKTAREIESFAARHDASVCSLYGDLPAAEQDRVLSPAERRKIVLATNVAETSVTIEGVTGVVDTGLARILRFDPVAGLDRLDLEPVSQSSADQRAGRAGRTAPGQCLRLWDEISHRHRPPQTDPEIRRVDLAGPVLQLKSWGEHDVLAFPWYEKPRPEAITQAELLLLRLGALDDQARMTDLGRQMVELPVHPRMARLLLEGARAGHARRAAWLAALLEERDPFFRSRSGGPSGSPPTRGVQHRSDSDVLDRLRALEEAEQGGPAEFAWGILNRGAAHHIARVRDQLLRHLRELLPTAPLSSDRNDEVLLRALVCAFPDRVARRRAPGSDKGLMVGGRGVKLGLQSSVRSGELFLCVDVDAGQTDALVRLASTVEREWLPDSSCRTQTDLFFHPSQKQVQARRREYFDDLILSETPTSLPDSDAPAELLFSEAVRDWNQVFPADVPGVAGFLQRVRSLSRWMPELGLPAFDEFQLHQVLRNLCAHCRSFSELKRADWLCELQSQLDWQQRQLVDREAPERLQVPSGNWIRLTYEEDRPPVLAVRIQEVFGLRETPRIAGGRVPVLLHLLAPNMRPQQVTDDLQSFWANTYPSVRKELARRYPKHSWPDDPLIATPRKKPGR